MYQETLTVNPSTKFCINNWKKIAASMNTRLIEGIKITTESDHSSINCDDTIVDEPAKKSTTR